MGEMSE